MRRFLLSQQSKRFFEKDVKFEKCLKNVALYGFFWSVAALEHAESVRKSDVDWLVKVTTFPAFYQWFA